MNIIHKWIDTITGMFARNWITLLGSSITTISAFLIIAFIFQGFILDDMPPYAGIIGFLILPGVFVGGLLLIPLGA